MARVSRPSAPYPLHLLPPMNTHVRILGRGAFGSVFLASQGFESVAIKRVLKRHASPNAYNLALQEASIMKSLNHPNVMRFVGVSASEEKVDIAMEYCRGGTLLDFMRARRRLSEFEARAILTQLLAAVEHMHSQGFVHRDLKLENIMFADEKCTRAVVGDFGLSSSFPEGLAQQGAVGSLRYVAPEVLLREYYEGPELDVWSLGVILYVMVTGALPFDEASDDLTMRKILAASFPVPSGLSASCWDLLHCMINADRTQRITISEIWRHPWFACAQKQRPVPAQLPADGVNEVSQCTVA